MVNEYERVTMRFKFLIKKRNRNLLEIVIIEFIIRFSPLLAGSAQPVERVKQHYFTAEIEFFSAKTKFLYTCIKFLPGETCFSF